MIIIIRRNEQTGKNDEHAGQQKNEENPNEPIWKGAGIEMRDRIAKLRSGTM